MLQMHTSLSGCTRPHRPGPYSSSRVAREKKGGSRDRYLRSAGLAAAVAAGEAAAAAAGGGSVDVEPSSLAARAAVLCAGLVCRICGKRTTWAGAQAGLRATAAMASLQPVRRRSRAVDVRYKLCVISTGACIPGSAAAGLGGGGARWALLPCRSTLMCSPAWLGVSYKLLLAAHMILSIH